MLSPLYNITRMRGMFSSRFVQALFNTSGRDKISLISAYRYCNTSSPSESVLLSKKLSQFSVHCVDSKGTRSSYDATKVSLYNELGLTVRDLRFQHVNMLTVRNKKIIARFQKLQAVICPHTVLLIDPPFDGSKAERNPGDEVFNLWKNLPDYFTGSALYTSSLPLEYKALEAILMHTMYGFSSTLSEIEPDVKKLLSTLTDPQSLVVDRSLVHVLLENSSRLNSFATLLREFCDTLEKLLECDDDIRDLCISINVEEGNRSYYDAYIFKPFDDQTESPANVIENSPSMEEEPHKLHIPKRLGDEYKINLQDEMEMLLDSFLRDAEDISNKVAELKEAIENSNTVILINLDSHRNVLLRLELQLTMGMFSCTLFGMLGMAFGMNLNSTMEENPFAFWAVSAFMFGGAGMFWRYLIVTLRRNVSSLSPSFLLKRSAKKLPVSSAP